ncbi:hypothetical protein NQ315_011926 [Exocentrus adspersus]|uniref:Ribosomal protein mS38 C-terminal domain-containing protein n=1 Tax=Exocentrus adspersus TaxID=1586481 RepID=A0AAV8W1G5_9CUCU|nr:hypothetical protein NQ315_011926 [Exocentrus adspersus]
MNFLIRISSRIRVPGSGLTVSRYLNTHNLRNTPLTPVLTQQSRVKNPWIWQQNDEINLPVAYKNRIELPNGLVWIPPLIDHPKDDKIIEAPSKEDTNIPKQAARLIVIRRKKMKKHKLKKLRKRLKFVRAKVMRIYAKEEN